MQGQQLTRALARRAAITRAIRGFFERRGFLEVDTPAIALSPGLEPHLDAIEVRVRQGMGGELVQRWLITSPEYHCKRLLAEGIERLYRLGKSFRSGERGAHHNPEFTMLEWYRAGATHVDIAADTVALIAAAAGASAEHTALPAAVERAVSRPAVELDFGAEVARRCGFDALIADDDAMLLAADEAGYSGFSGESAADLLMRAWVERVELRLPADRVVVVAGYPARLASLARLSPADPRVAERVEVYLCGVELANGFSELVDPVQQRARFEADLATRRAMGLPVYPMDEAFLEALGRCPDAAGIALGVDRLVMVPGGCETIDEVIAFPFERA